MQARPFVAPLLVIALLATPVVAGQVTYSFNGGTTNAIQGLDIDPKTPILVVRPNTTVETTFALKNTGNRTLNVTLSTMSMSTSGGATYTVTRPDGGGSGSSQSNAQPAGSGNATLDDRRGDNATVFTTPAGGGNGTASGSGQSVAYSRGAFAPALDVSVSPRNVTVPAGETVEVSVRLKANANATGDHQVMLMANEMEDPRRSASGSVSVRIPKPSAPRGGANDSRSSSLLDVEPVETPFAGAAALAGASLVAIALRRAGGRR
ncbi:MAG TPA: hypothetical protein VM889_11715 [Candidatus Thermoplasmatota archaeon]|nr:hypothetical protein [Candidatus Thermoplasmatota archaeon]